MRQEGKRGAESEGTWGISSDLRFTPGASRCAGAGHVRNTATALGETDVFVSTASHEFFGIAVVEAAAAGALAIVPHGLAYPEVLGAGWALFHDGSVEGIADAIEEAARRLEHTGSVWQGDERAGRVSVGRYRWSERAATLDRRLERVVSSGRRAG